MGRAASEAEEELEGALVGSAVEAVLEGGTEDRGVRVGPGEEGHRRTELDCVRTEDVLDRPPSSRGQRGFDAFDQAASEQRVAEVGGSASSSDVMAYSPRHRAGPEAGQLREDEPDPVGALPPRAEARRAPARRHQSCTSTNRSEPERIGWCGWLVRRRWRVIGAHPPERTSAGRRTGGRDGSRAGGPDGPPTLGPGAAALPVRRLVGHGSGRRGLGGGPWHAAALALPALRRRRRHDRPRPAPRRCSWPTTDRPVRSCPSTPSTTWTTSSPRSTARGGRSRPRGSARRRGRRPSCVIRAAPRSPCSASTVRRRWRPPARSHRERPRRPLIEAEGGGSGWRRGEGSRLGRGARADDRVGGRRGPGQGVLAQRSVPRLRRRQHLSQPAGPVPVAQGRRRRRSPGAVSRDQSRPRGTRRPRVTSQERGRLARRTTAGRRRLRRVVEDRRLVLDGGDRCHGGAALQ